MKKGEKLNQLSVVTMQRMIDEKDHRIAVLERAFKKACKQLSEAYGECPYANMNLEMPDYCEKECGKHEELLCWDVYLIDQAEKELKDESNNK